jgi:hypothetical protein
MSIRRTASTSGGSPGAGGFWTALAAWGALAVSLANLVLLMRLWDRLPAQDLGAELEGVLRGDRQGQVQEPAPRPAATVDRPPQPVASDTLAALPAQQPAAGAGQPAPENARPGIRLQVLNGSGVRLLAARAAENLRRMGYDVRETGTAPDSLEKSQVVSRVENPAPSLRLAQDLGLSSARIRYSADPALVDVDLTLILGADYQKLSITGNQ